MTATFAFLQHMKMIVSETLHIPSFTFYTYIKCVVHKWLIFRGSCNDNCAQKYDGNVINLQKISFISFFLIFTKPNLKRIFATSLATKMTTD